jgi:hypothetical protein
MMECAATLCYKSERKLEIIETNLTSLIPTYLDSSGEAAKPAITSVTGSL